MVLIYQRCQKCGHKGLIVCMDGIVECPECGFWFRDKELARDIFKL